MRTQGTAIARAKFEGGPNDDSFLYNSSGDKVSFVAGAGDDVFSYRGSATSVEYLGDLGNDRVVYGGIAPNGPSPSVVLDGGTGNDRYEFSTNPEGFVLLVEDFVSSGDASVDTLDFSAFTSGNISLDLASTLPQAQPGNLTLQLSNGMGVESIYASSGADTVLGNDRDNYIGGALYYYPSNAPILVAPRAEAQWVYLDFDTYTESLIGEHIYTIAERQEIQQRIEAVYYGYDQVGNNMVPRTYSSPNRWFNVRFTQNLADISNAGITDYVRIQFNETPSYGRPGGESSEIDVGNLRFTGTATVQVNGLLGGIEVPVAADEDFTEQLPEDAEQAVGQDKPAATSANFVAISAKIAAHELAHLLGLRHYDAFGPIGFGIHSPPGVAEFKPQFQGASAAFETFDHIIGSPASVGSTRANDTGQLFFGEREAVKIALSMSDVAQVFHTESSLPTSVLGTLTTRTLSLATLQVPNTLARGLNSVKNFYVQATSVEGTIDLVAGNSESDFYQFSGQEGDLITIEIGSRALRRFTDQGVDGFIDSIVRLRDQNGQLVQSYNLDAVNDDEFESSDSLLMDVRLPRSGSFIIEVDSFYRPPSNELYSAMMAKIAHLESLTVRTTEQQEELEQLIDSRDDTDVGSYQLFLYNFAKANRST